LDFELPGQSDERRLSVRKWLAEHPNPSADDLADAGFVAPHWPAPWGLDADAIFQIIIDEELRAAKVIRPNNPIGIGWAGPTILAAGSEEQKSRYLGPILSGQEVWCQLFSEPEAGSDLASLSTRGTLDGDTYVISGQKIWTTFGHQASFGILIARTDFNSDKQHGITYFICPMDSPGITITPIVDMTGQHAFNQVFFDDVRIPAENVVGEVNHGWSLAKVTLANERVSLSSGGAVWGAGPTVYDLINLVRSSGGIADPVMRQRIAAIYTEAEILKLIRYRTITASIRGIAPGPETSVRKLMSDEHGKSLLNLGKDLALAGGMVAGSAPLETDGLPSDGISGFSWGYAYLFSPALTIGGGTAEVQRNIIAERVLGLPRDY